MGVRNYMCCSVGAYTVYHYVMLVIFSQGMTLSFYHRLRDMSHVSMAQE